MKHRRKFYFKGSSLKPLSKSEILDVLKKEVFSNGDFKKHVIKVSQNLDIDEKTVEEVIKSYIINVTLMINAVQKIKTKINVYGFLRIFIKKGRYI